MKKSTIRNLAVVAVFTALALSACGGNKAPSKGPKTTAEGLIPIRTNTKLTCTSTPYWELLQDKASPVNPDWNGGSVNIGEEIQPSVVI